MSILSVFAMDDWKLKTTTSVIVEIETPDERFICFDCEFA